MFCHVAQRKYSDFAGHIEDEVVKRRIPYMGTLELTYRCNLSCCHCYCNLNAGDGNKAAEMPTGEIKRILDEAADAGCLWLLLTGGEVLLRDDFPEIYRYALKKGMLVEVFTNATLIDEDIAKLFSDFEPLGIDISIYGSNPGLHDKITRIDGSFEKMMAGTGLLKKHNVKFSFKTILMPLNYPDLDNMQRFAKDLGVEYRFDTVICPRIDGGTEPTECRLTAEEMVCLDLEKDFEACEWIFENFWNKKCEEPLACGAGIFSFNVNPYGILSPCVMFASFQRSLKEASFKDTWAGLVDEYGAKSKHLTPPECRSCSMALICSHCPAAAELETKSLNKTVNYLCGYAKKLEEMYFIKKREVEDAKKTV